MNTTNTIYNLRQAKFALESKISEMITEFQNEYEVKVDRVGIDNIHDGLGKVIKSRVNLQITI